MPDFAVIRVIKLKGGTVAASDQHAGRSRDTPNADPGRLALNHVLLGEDRELREMVAERVREENIWRRKDSVEVVEVLLTASRTHFLDDDEELDDARVRRWLERNVEWLKQKYGDRVLKAVSHLDERTPHITAYVLPVIEGRLNAKDFVGGREDLERLQDEYAAAMKDLGLHRGVRGSRARHEDIGRFYGTILEPVTLEVDREQVRVPSGWEVATRKGREAYREEVIAAVLGQVESQVGTIRNQALLTLEETRRRERAERRAAERVEAAGCEAREKIAAAERAAEERVRDVGRAARDVLDENRELRDESQALRGERNGLNEALIKMTREKLDYQAEARRYHDRLTDVPMPEVMGRLGYEEERQGQAHVYRDAGGQVAIRVEGQKAFDARGRLICGNSMDLVVHVRQRQEGVREFTAERALGWLRDEFGEGRAAGAYVVNREQAALGLFARERAGRDRQPPGRGRGEEPWPGPERVREGHDRGSRGRGSRDGRGSGGRGR